MNVTPVYCPSCEKACTDADLFCPGCAHRLAPPNRVKQWMFDADAAEMAAQESVAAEIHRAAMLMKCPACRRECSVNAVACPGCAEPLKKVVTIADAVATAPPPLKKGEIICANPHCNFRGKPTRVNKGSVVVMIILLLLWIIPGVLYAIFKGGYQYKCPRCGKISGTD